MNKVFTRALLLASVLISAASVQSAYAVEDCPGHLALRQKDIVLKPGVTQVFLYDFRDPACLSVALRGFWAYVADAISADSEGCSTNVPRNVKLDMELTDLTTGVKGTAVSASSVILNDPIPHPDGYYIWGNYNVTGRLVELKITLSSSVRKCLKANLRYAFSMGG